MTRRSSDLPLNLLRGALMGCAEVVPGVSGGTVALITGVYERLVDAAARLTAAVRTALTGGGLRAARAKAREADARLLVPLFAGMIAALVLGARLIAPFVEEHPQQARALFFGLVLASLWVPYRAAGRPWRLPHYALAATVAVAAFALTGLPPAHAPPRTPRCWSPPAPSRCARWRSRASPGRSSC